MEASTTLLDPTRDSGDYESNNGIDSPDDIELHVRRNDDESQRTALTCAAINVLLMFGKWILISPSLPLMELGLCREYYDPSVINKYGFIEEKLCKITSIQVSLANLRP